MNYAELQQAILDDSHRTDFAGAIVQRMIAEGEARILAKVEAYSLVTTLTDAQRVDPTKGEYTIAGKVVVIREVFDVDGNPLDRVDESLAAQYRTLSTSKLYVPRPASILIAGNPGAGSSFVVHFFGLPDALSVTPTNTLLDDFPQLYKNASLVSLHQRTKDYEAAQAALDDFVGLANEINRKTRKMLGGKRSANPYNVTFRSSY